MYLVLSIPQQGKMKETRAAEPYKFKFICVHGDSQPSVHRWLLPAPMSNTRSNKKKRKRCATKVGGGGLVRRLLLHEGSKKVDNSGAEYGRAPRKVYNTGKYVPSPPSLSTLRHRAAKSAVTYAKRGAQSGLKSFLPLSAGGTNVARPVIIARPKFESRRAKQREARLRKKIADLIQPLLVQKQKTSIFACIRSPQACELLPITAAANRFLLYVLKYIPPHDVCAQLIYDTEHLSAEFLEVCVTYAAPFGMRCQWRQGKQGKVKNTQKLIYYKISYSTVQYGYIFSFDNIILRHSGLSLCICSVAVMAITPIFTGTGVIFCQTQHWKRERGRKLPRRSRFALGF